MQKECRTHGDHERTDRGEENRVHWYRRTSSLPQISDLEGPLDCPLADLVGGETAKVTLLLTGRLRPDLHWESLVEAAVRTRDIVFQVPHRHPPVGQGLASELDGCLTHKRTEGRQNHHFISKVLGLKLLLQNSPRVTLLPTF